MAQIDPEDADYVCSLSEKSIAKAKQELHEDPKERLSAVKALRDWIKQQPHLNVPTDTIMLLRFLRCSKFSQLRARTLIDNTYSLYQEAPNWFTNIDIYDPDIRKFIEKGEFVPLGYNKDGCFVVLNRIAVQDTNLLKDPVMLSKLKKATHATYGYFLNNEENQVNGFVTLVDATGITAKHQGNLSIAEMKIMSKFWRNAMTMRYKAFHVYNTGPIAEAMLQIVRPFMPKKFSERFFMHGSNLESVYKVVPMELLPDEYLPDDYTGPCAGPVQSLIDKFVNELYTKEFADYLKDVSNIDKYNVNKDKRLKEVQASFRKLNVD